MKKLFTAGAIAMLLAISGPVQAGGFSGSVNGVLGAKKFDTGKANPRNLLLFGVMSDYEFGGFPIRLSVDALFAGRTKEINDEDVTFSTFELGVGGRWAPNIGNFQPFLGGGLSLLSAYVDSDALMDDDSDATVGGFITAGAYYKVGGNVNVGAVYRYTIGEVELFDNDTNITSHHYAIMVGYSW